MAGFSREDIVKQFPVAVVATAEGYTCPSCSRLVNHGSEKCTLCGQTLSWTNIQEKAEDHAGKKNIGVIKVNLPADFAVGNCRKCPISYISKIDKGNVYTCPIAGNHQENCPIVIEEQ